jgi:peroxiredoxin
VTSVPVVGEPAPGFVLPDQHGQPVDLADLRGRPVLLVFFPYVFTPTCTGELCTLRDEQGDFDAVQARLVGISCDPTAAQRAFADSTGVTYPLLSDFWPHGEVARRYGVFVEERGFATRGTFLIDGAGVLRWCVVNGPGEARAVTDYREALAAL